MTGKLVLPIIEREDGYYEAFFLGESQVVQKNKLDDLKKKASAVGYIPYATNKEEATLLKSNPKKLNELFEKLQVETMERWLTMIPERVPENCRVILTPGNDDSSAIDSVISQDSNVVYGEERAIPLDEEHEVVCCGWTNPTPWQTPRECSEEKLYEKLERVVSQVRDFRRAISCFHCPPYDSQIDLAPKLNEKLMPVYARGAPVMTPVGSKSVRLIIEKYQPLLSLHDHVHESSGFTKIRRTQCLNPGSEYSEGIMHGFLVEIEGEKIGKLQRVEA